jgi:hypothetical protein
LELLGLVSATGIAVTVRAVFLLMTPLDVVWDGDAVVDFSQCKSLARRRKCDRALDQ